MSSLARGTKAAEGGLTIPALLSRLQSLWTPLLIAVVVLAAIGVIAYVHNAVKRIEDQLPLRVMQEKRDMERVARTFYDFLAATEAALAHPTEGNVASIRDNLDAVERDLEALRERYTFDTLIGASALHAVMTPAVDDARIWLTEGFGALAPTSPILLDLVATRVRDTMSKVYDKTTEADRIAYNILEQQSVGLRQLGTRLILVLVAVALLAGGVIWLAVRQQRIARGREMALQEFNAVLESIDYGVVFMGPDLRVRIANRAFRELWNVPQALIDRRPPMRELIEYNRHNGLHDVDDASWDAWIENRIDQIRHGDIPAREFARGDGKVLDYQSVALPDGGRMLTYFDITELKEREAEIMQAKDAAEAALADLQRAQERLIQAEKMASLGQLTAGIAHEIKNPLNFVNNFAKLSDELLDELSEALEAPLNSLDETARAEADDLLRTVRGNLAKINQHGKRADSIVKNMLLHAREGPSERQTLSLNAIAEEALNLAFHGARAEHPGFSIEMVKSLAPEVGEVECYPQDLMRVFLNLFSNGMYAANKRQCQAAGDYTPTIALTTRAEGEQVEVEVRDNGTGIPPELRDRIFIPFFTTKPVGEGTGLGLSLSYDIVVKQHGGDLSVESEPGEFTAFRVRLPRRLSDSEGDRQ